MMHLIVYLLNISCRCVELSYCIFLSVSCIYTSYKLVLHDSLQTSKFNPWNTKIHETLSKVKPIPNRRKRQRPLTL